MLRRSLKIIRRGIAILLIVIAVVFAVSNRARIVVSFFPLPFEMETPVYMLGLLFFALGVLAGYSSASGTLLRLSRLLKKSRDRLEAVEQEKSASQTALLHSLR